MNNFSNYTIEQLSERLGQARFMAYMALYCGDSAAWLRYIGEIREISEAFDELTRDNEGGCYAWNYVFYCCALVSKRLSQSDHELKRTKGWLLGHPFASHTNIEQLTT